MNGNPQTEDGFVRIATELWSAFCRLRIPGEARQVLDAIIRKTYGYNKKEDGIPLSQFVELTGLSKPKVCRAILKLQAMNIISVAQKGNDEWKTYGLNKVFSTWKPLPKKAMTNPAKSLPKRETTVAQKGNASLPKKGTSIDNASKDNVSIDTSSTKKGPRPSVERVMLAMKEIFGPLDDSEKNNRRYAWLLIQRALKNKPGSSEEDSAAACVALIEAAAKHDWWGTRIKRVETLYRNAQLIAEALRSGHKQSTVFKI